jgi:hypothetical protein
MSSELIIWPMIMVALATLWIYLPMSKARVQSVKSGKTEASAYRLNIGEPEESLRFSNALRNQFETPVLFYAVCLAAFVTETANSVMIFLAFAYALIKVLHISIHITTNRLRHRRPIFMLSYLILSFMWLVLAVRLTGII